MESFFEYWNRVFKLKIISSGILPLFVLLLAACEENKTANKAKTQENSIAKMCEFSGMPLCRVDSSTSGTLSDYTVAGTDLWYSIEQLSEDKEHELLAPSSVYINKKPLEINQCGIYDIKIKVNGVVVKHIPDFYYSGEDVVLVGRGVGWCLYINRNDWQVNQ